MVFKGESVFLELLFIGLFIDVSRNFILDNFLFKQVFP